MQSVHGRPPGDIPPIEELISGRPSFWSGMSVRWTTEDDPAPVFVERFPAPLDRADGHLDLFGARYDIADALFDGASLGHGHLVEYFLVERPGGAWRARRLLQRRSVTYSEGDEVDDYLPAGEVDAQTLCVGRPPRWEAKSEAVWPTASGGPMLFVGQTRLPENEVTRTLLTWDRSLYLFWLRVEGSDHFKLVAQPVGRQTAEDHYSIEEEWLK